jgi:hypothetical protein
LFFSFDLLFTFFLANSNCFFFSSFGIGFLSLL